MRLSRAGIQTGDIEPNADIEPTCDVDPHSDADAEDGAPVRPQHVTELLRYWHRTLHALDDDYTFGDLLALLREVEDIDLLSPMLGCDISAFLADGARPLQPTEREDEPPLRFLQVRTTAELTTYEPDPDHPDEPWQWLDASEAAAQDSVDAAVASLTGERSALKVVDATGDDPITGEPVLQRLHIPEQHGRWTEPYLLTHEFEGWGRWSEPHDGYFAAHPEIDPEHFEGAYALSMTPLASLVHLPLRYNAAVQFWPERHSGGGSARFETRLTITFGEFLYAIFEEVGFHGSPEGRDEARDMLRERVAAIDGLEDRGGGASG